MDLRLAESTSTAAPSDEVLTQRLVGGQTKAGEELVRRYYRPLIRYLQRMTGNDHLAEELHQQTWLSVLEHLDKFDPSGGAGGFKAWLFRIATNKANDHWRSRGRDSAAKEVLRLAGSMHAPPAGDRPESAEEAQKLHRAIGQLPEAQREVLLLRYYADMKFIDIARMLGCPLNTALGRMHKAVLKLRQLLEP
jgi:RNA polymerase sigma-70 factor (ECF subfamily)